jgi:DNA invertase Pin-like site-specific DNA recombinase
MSRGGRMVRVIEHRTNRSDYGLDSKGNADATRAAEYVRMSTEHQQYSTENQAEAIRDYARRRGIEIVRTYADEGRSGLRLAGRDALKQLIDDVQSGKANFTAILVYDVSRWGRFQDPDESAYYEYICKRAGISVHYCAEQFENDGSPVSTIVKGVKRAMAGEYSRELSAKVFAGQCRLIERGFRQGGPAGFGLRRQLIDQSKNPKSELARGEHKSIQTDRVVLVPGPIEEVETVRWMYRMFVEAGEPEREIARLLNERGIKTDLGRPWTRGTVHQILINEKYAGNNVWNRISFRLKRKRIRNDPDMWIRANGAFTAIIDQVLFDAARTIIQARSFRLSDVEMLAALEALFKREGQLSGIIIDEAEGLPSSSAYRLRFGSLLRAYQLVGFRPRRDYRYIEINRLLRKLHPGIIDEIIGQFRAVGCVVKRDLNNDLISINNEFSVSVVIARCRQTQSGAYRWRLRLDTSLCPDITIAVRMDGNNRTPLDYYLLPRIDVENPKLRFAEENGLALDSYRFNALDFFYELARPVWIAKAA